jgi:hypothetical protein
MQPYRCGRAGSISMGRGGVSADYNAS